MTPSSDGVVDLSMCDAGSGSLHGGYRDRNNRGSGRYEIAICLKVWTVDSVVEEDVREHSDLRPLRQI